MEERDTHKIREVVYVVVPVELDKLGSLTSIRDTRMLLTVNSW